jgi:hypothetical protein
MDKRFEFYKEQYYFELNRKNELGNALAIPIGFLSAIFTAYSYLFLHLKFWEQKCLRISFILLISISILFTIKALYSLYHSIRGLTYGYAPDPKALYDFELQYIKYNQDIQGDKENIDHKFFERLKASLVATATNNRMSNNFRSEKILNSNENNMYAIIFLFLSAIPFIINTYL